MIGKLAKLGALLFCLAIPACGPALDLCDDMQGRVGRYTPSGLWKRDFWGRWYFEPYPCRPSPKTEAADTISPPNPDAEEARKAP
jgi:hypothetical protein